MSSVFKRDSGWVVKWKDAAGRWKTQRTECATKAQAKAFAQQLEHRAAQQRRGLTPNDAPTTMTFGDLIAWYDEHHAHLVKSPSRRLTAGKNLADLNRLALVDVTTARLENLLNEKAKTLKPETINGLRAFANRIFNLAMRAGLWTLPNPVARIPRAKVPKRPPAWLRPHEVSVLLPQVPERWRALFACAVYTGMRRGELVALQKRDVELTGRRPCITVCRSWGEDSTKGKEVRVVPIHPELVPYLATAIDQSPSELVFPRADGSMHTEDINLPALLRSALARAGLVKGWLHKCRWCEHVTEQVKDAELRRCPVDGKKLWPSPVHRTERFHDLRHTTATLLLKMGTPLAMVQRLIGHSDPAITTEVYGHIEVEDVRPHVERLSFLSEPEPEVIALPMVANGGAPVVRDVSPTPAAADHRGGDREQERALAESMPSRKEQGPGPPTGTSAGALQLPPGSTASHPFDISRGEGRSEARPLSTASTDSTQTKRGGAPVVRVTPSGVRLVEDALRVSEVAAALNVVPNTVYLMIDRGELASFRIGGRALRVRRSELERVMRGGGDS